MVSTIAIKVMVDFSYYIGNSVGITNIRRHSVRMRSYARGTKAVQYNIQNRESVRSTLLFYRTKVSKVQFKKFCTYTVPSMDF